MAVTPLDEARPAVPLLTQYVVPCPTCAAPGAAHVDATSEPAVLVRFVCAEGCTADSVGADAIRAAISSAQPCAEQPAPAA